ncbi:hypothetical protein GUITHDRAFT_109013 [Guillardia theta CCMP2712]|uniref:EF-hand domain-containing protein n=1 Tax=Guillardia theta (strain CCMP2712) TaxID=905079 RepID=L1JA55_GUITC|nr:hypothetical protein GUITHDRAFT_109013 [Guillardia theta CCMP2712]EKX44970.1 hypothetical protein GUITHDRAFT_109013 [Guillardia theta CCMP2712]|eukprot:XP_005831950.1 hypothetical protein GUITHDRAFT_109013 [Guillardia theta CCMP2712]
MDAILAVFDRDGDGKIDFKEFQDIVGSYLLPPSTDGMSLSFQLDHRPQRPQGRRPISRSGLTTAWNNNYCQMLDDVSQETKPLLTSIMQGKFYYGDRSSPQWRRADRSRSEIDNSRMQPLMKSLLEGEFYIPKERIKTQSTSTRTNFIAQNRRKTMRSATSNSSRMRSLIRDSSLMGVAV